jgi:DNA-binding transcriptional MerR regulator
MRDDVDIFDWAWERRKKDKMPADEPRYSMAEAIKILRCYSDPKTTDKQLRDYERIGAVKPERTEGRQRAYSISNILSLHLMLLGTKSFGKKDTVPIVKLYEVSRRQPKRFDPVIFDYDPQLPGEKKVHEILHEPFLKSSFQQVSQLVSVVRKVDDFLHMNEFAKKNGIGFKCHEKELLKVKRAGMELKIAPPLTEWESVRKARDWMRFFLAEARVQETLPARRDKKAREAFEKKVHKQVIDWLLKKGHAVKLKG